MVATLTDLARRTKEVIRPVIHGGKRVLLTEHGKVVAEIRPVIQPLSPDEFSKLWRNRPRLGKDVAEDVAAALHEIDAAE